jgi:predicted ATP-binding protein involved in virulence
MSETLLITVPGIGKTLVKDFARIGLYFVEDFETKIAEEVFQALYEVNELENHSTSKNYLYVIRMLIYYANDGREDEKIKWNYWKD